MNQAVAKPLVTLFGVPKPFSGQIAVTQRNAIGSWSRLRPAADVYILGDETGCAETAGAFDIGHIPEIQRNEHGTPLVDAIFKTMEEVSKTDIVCYLNSDIMLTDGFMEAVRTVAGKWKHFLMVGRRWDVDIKTPWDFDEKNWEDKLLSLVANEGRLHSSWGIDYFCFTRGTFGRIPPFALGRPPYDNWLIYKARALKIPVIDATERITAIHQNHDYSHFANGKQTFREGPEAKKNARLAGGLLFDLQDATWLLTPRGLKRALSPSFIRQRMWRLKTLSPVLFLPLAPLVSIYRFVINLTDQAGKR